LNGPGGLTSIKPARHLLVVAGPNGSGKTALVRQGVLSRILQPPAISLNADDLARELAGGQRPTPAQSLQAAQLCDDRLDAEIAAGRSVIIETVLASDERCGASFARPTASTIVKHCKTASHTAQETIAQQHVKQ
jgi:predicted ABC-type ATPase